MIRNMPNSPYLPCLVDSPALLCRYPFSAPLSPLLSFLLPFVYFHQQTHFLETLLQVMDWDKQPPPQPPAEDPPPPPTGGMFVKVMTDEQMEVLRKQIAVYSSICEQLVELHKSLTSQNDLAGVRLGSLYCDPLISSGAHKITGRQRWTPTPMQLQILERIFDQGIGTPSKQKIKEITAELSQHGQISETNVYNWFQNRRARSKRKQHATTTNNAELEVETEVESPNDKKTKPEEFQAQHILSARSDELCFQNPQSSSAIHSVDPRTSKPEPLLHSDANSKFGGNFGQIPFYGGMLSTLRMDQFKIEVPGSYKPYLELDDFNMDG